MWLLDRVWLTGVIRLVGRLDRLSRVITLLGCIDRGFVLIGPGHVVPLHWVGLNLPPKANRLKVVFFKVDQF
jgi:hypothetical protein